MPGRRRSHRDPRPDVAAGVRAAAISLATVAVVSLLLGQLAKALQSPVDDWFFTWMEDLGTTAWTDVLTVTTQMGNVWQTQVLTAVLAVALAGWFAVRRWCWWMPLLVLPLAWATTRVAQLGLAWATGRERDLISLVGTEVGAYPSGGVARIIVVTGTAVVLVAHYARPSPRTVRWLAGGVALLGVSEMYFRARLNQHWLTDVVAGFAVGALLVWAVGFTLRAFHPAGGRSPDSADPAGPRVARSTPLSR